MAKLTAQFKGRLHEYFKQKLGAFDYRNGWMKSACPYCGADNKFGINLSQNRSNCFKCEERPNLINLVMYLEKVDTYAEVKSIINKGDYEGYTFTEEKVELRSSKDLYLPEGFNSILFGNSQLAKSARNYITKKRSFSLPDVVRNGWGYCDSGKYFGYLIIPFTYRNKLVYFNARKILGSGPKYNNPEVDVTGVGKAMILYNRDALETYETVYLCEGAINAATLGEQAIASGGKAVSRYQVNLIIKSQVKKVILLLDSDAKDKALELGMELVQYKKVKVVYLPDGKDVNDIGKAETMKLVYSTPYQTYNELLQLKQKL